MRGTLIAASTLLAVLLTGCSPDSPEETGSEEKEPKEPKAAVAQLQNADGDRVGTATLTETENGVDIHLKAMDLESGEHGFHIHETGTCQPPDFQSAGGHFNPEDKAHGKNNPDGSHAGDLPNLEIQSGGTGELKVTAKGTTLGPGDHSLLKKDGTALVIHEDPDDLKTDPAGDAGDRIACGVVKEK
ncbi:superoxide dismutase family protein [Paludifilum halophilum]|uniref:Superoxide dismutase [Cu-Zn] n=1 Tax=Paludifilum halophilum TaxID=1642702 RepID=A0A235B8P5_9BACL|nr:superoxide dismutase family protein [Paludifilum halophilum]OYD08359.1 hypothetical protein CHM34_05815 [Paludifilum halophilum]